jgi:hypothetical protein
MSRGVLYLASGRKYIEDAVSSAKSLKRYNPHIPVILYTDEDICLDIFDRIIPLDSPINEMGDSILSGKHLPFNKNLYIDVDTHICGDISGIFELLNKYELAVAPNASGLQWNSDIYDDNNISLPHTFPEFNTGVIGYTDCNSVVQFFDDWKTQYNVQNQDMVNYKTNQPSFRTALFNSDINYTTLLPEYNFQINRHAYARSNVKILHNTGGSGVDIEDYARRINSQEGPRAVTLDNYPCRVVSHSSPSIKYRIKNNINMIRHHIGNSKSRNNLTKKIRKMLKEDGILATLKYISNKLL